MTDKGITLTARLLKELAASITDIGESYTGVCDSGMAASTITIVCNDLKDFDDDYFNNGWLMYIAHNDDAPGTAPEGETRDITDYVGTTGTFTTAAFSANVEEDDVVIVARVTTFIIDQVKLIVSPVDGSLASFISSGNGSASYGSRIGTDKSIVDAIGHNGVARLDSGIDGLLANGLLNGTGAVLPNNKSIYDILGTGYIHDAGNFTHSIRRHLRRGLAGANATTVLAEDKSLLDYLITLDTAGTHDITTANDKIETDVVEITDTTKYGLSMYFDLNTLVAAGEGGTVTIRMKNKIDESTYREVGKATFIVGSTTTHPSFEVMRINHNVKFTIQCSTDVTVTRQINYRYIKEPKE